MKKKEENQNKLEAFRSKAQKKHCKYWKNPEDLGGKVSRSLVQLKKKHPSDGWIPGSFAADESLFRRLEELRSRVHELEQQEVSSNLSAPESTKDLAQGDEIYTQPCTLKDAKGNKQEVDLKASWDKIFAYAGSAMIGECTEQEFFDQVQLVYWHSVPDELIKYNSYNRINIYQVVFDNIKIQLQALGLITYGTKKRAVSDINTYWKLTPYGEKYLLQVRAIRSGEAEPRLMSW